MVTISAAHVTMVSMVMPVNSECVLALVRTCMLQMRVEFVQIVEHVTKPVGSVPVIVHFIMGQRMPAITSMHLHQ